VEEAYGTCIVKLIRMEDMDACKPVSWKRPSSSNDLRWKIPVTEIEIYTEKGDKR
jgi:hypothetical protein